MASLINTLTLDSNYSYTVYSKVYVDVNDILAYFTGYYVSNYLLTVKR